MLAAATILGSGGFVPTGRRETPSLLLRGAASDATPVVIDAGTGLRRLITDRERWLGDARRLDILLSHFHIDHVCGLAYLTELADLEIVIHGPGAALYETSTAEILSRMFFSPPLMPVTLDQLGVRVAELAPGAPEVGGLAVAARRQDQHPNPTLGFRIGDALATLPTSSRKARADGTIRRPTAPRARPRPCARARRRCRKRSGKIRAPFPPRWSSAVRSACSWASSSVRAITAATGRGAGRQPCPGRRLPSRLTDGQFCVAAGRRPTAFGGSSPFARSCGPRLVACEVQKAAQRCTSGYAKRPPSPSAPAAARASLPGRCSSQGAEAPSSVSAAPTREDRDRA